MKTIWALTSRMGKDNICGATTEMWMFSQIFAHWVFKAQLLLTGEEGEAQSSESQVHPDCIVSDTAGISTMFSPMEL